MPISKLLRASNGIKKTKKHKIAKRNGDKKNSPLEMIPEYSDEDAMSDIDLTEVENGISEEEFWARKLGIVGSNKALAKERLAEEYSKDGLGDDFLELFDFMDEVRDKANETKNPKDEEPEDASAKKYIPPHRREGVTSSAGTVSAKAKQTTSLLGLLNRVSEGNLDSISLEIISLILRSKVRPCDFARALVGISCDNPNITVTLQGTFAAIACAVAVETAPSNQFSGSVLACLVARIKEVAASEDSPRVVTNLIRFTACLFSMGLFSVDVIESLLSFVVSLRGVPTERILEWILACLRFAGRVLRDHHKSRFIDALQRLIDSLPQGEGMLVEFGLKELKSMKEGKSGFRAVDHLQSVCEWLAVRAAPGKPKKSSEGSTLIGWKVPRQVEAVQLVVPTLDAFDSKYTFPTDWTGSGEQPQSDIIERETGISNSMPSLEELASMNRMTTEVKKNAFIAVMGSVDSKHALLRLDQFSLLEPKNVPSIVAVVIHCALQETCVNPFYISLVESLCAQQDKKMSRKFSISFKIEFSKLVASGKLTQTEIGVLSTLIASYIGMSNGQVTMEDILRSPKNQGDSFS